jgi:CheY-like chemotaxis protein
MTPCFRLSELVSWVLRTSSAKSSWNKSTPIIIVTGRADRQTMQDAVAVEASFFLQKPVDRQKLSALFRMVSGGMLEDRRKYMRVQSRWTSPAQWLPNRRRNNLEPPPRGMQVERGGLSPKDVLRLSFQLPISGAANRRDWGELRSGKESSSTNAGAQSQQSIRKFVGEPEEIGTRHRTLKS